jgi:GT2 family glycosyltransferase
MTAEMTIILLNYQRPGNIPIILDTIRRQTLKSFVFLWNNGPDDVNLPGLDRYETAGENLGCMVRWNLAREADTQFVMTLDDDLCFARNDALADVVESLRNMDDPARIVGPVGCRFGETPSYTERSDVYAEYARAGMSEQTIRSTGYEAVDMVKGRSMALRRDRLDGLELPEEREDDVYLSAAMADGRRLFHRIPKRLKFAFRELPEHGVGNWQRPEHFCSRDRASEAYFGSRTRQPGPSEN